MGEIEGRSEVNEKKRKEKDFKENHRPEGRPSRQRKRGMRVFMKHELFRTERMNE